MTRLTAILCLLFLATSISYAQEKKELDVIELEQEAKIVVENNLSNGMTMPLRWAANSSVACFPATRFYEYKGNHLLYRVQMPAQSKMIITVTPKSKKNRINLYAFRLGVNNFDTPPEISSAISCEASYPIYAGNPNVKAPTKPKSVEYISINRPYNILIGVAGAEGVTEGDFELKIEIMDR